MFGKVIIKEILCTNEWNSSCEFYFARKLLDIFRGQQNDK